MLGFTCSLSVFLFYNPFSSLPQFFCLVADSLYDSHLSVRPSAADGAPLKPSLTSSNWSVDRAISVLALSSDKGQTPFPAPASEKGGEGVCVRVWVFLGVQGRRSTPNIQWAGKAFSSHHKEPASPLTEA